MKMNDYEQSSPIDLIEALMTYKDYIKGLSVNNEMSLVIYFNERVSGKALKAFLELKRIAISNQITIRTYERSDTPFLEFFDNLNKVSKVYRDVDIVNRDEVIAFLIGDNVPFCFGITGGSDAKLSASILITVE